MSIDLGIDFKGLSTGVTESDEEIDSNMDELMNNIRSWVQGIGGHIDEKGKRVTSTGKEFIIAGTGATAHNIGPCSSIMEEILRHK